MGNGQTTSSVHIPPDGHYPGAAAYGWKIDVVTLYCNPTNGDNGQTPNGSGVRREGAVSTNRKARHGGPSLNSACLRISACMRERLSSRRLARTTADRQGRLTTRKTWYRIRHATAVGRGPRAQRRPGVAAAPGLARLDSRWSRKQTCWLTRRGRSRRTGRPDRV